VNDDDGATSNAAVVTLAVTGQAIAVDDHVRTNEGVPVGVDVLVNDSGSIDATTIQILGPPVGPCSGSSATLDPVSNSIWFAPPAAPNCYGDYQFSYTVDNASGQTSNPAIVSIIVNARPFADAIYFTTPINTEVLLSYSWHDQDGIIIPESTIIKTSPTVGIAVMDQGGLKIKYIPAPGVCGEVEFTYTVTDDQGATSDEAIVHGVIDWAKGNRGVTLNEVHPSEGWVEICNRETEPAELAGWTVGGQVSTIGSLAGGTCEVMAVPPSLLVGWIRLLDTSGVEVDAVDIASSCYVGDGVGSLSLGRCGPVTGSDCMDYGWIEISTPGEF
ncbi:MAG: Ig-like domain-containing protein, partial [Deferrisomatales bacterium]|nr:Ig-like domain-containing protein [Deferrisomatales bacterium]